MPPATSRARSHSPIALAFSARRLRASSSLPAPGTDSISAAAISVCAPRTSAFTAEYASPTERWHDAAPTASPCASLRSACAALTCLASSPAGISAARRAPGVNPASVDGDGSFESPSPLTLTFKPASADVGGGSECLPGWASGGANAPMLPMFDELLLRSGCFTTSGGSGASFPFVSGGSFGIAEMESIELCLECRPAPFIGESGPGDSGCGEMDPISPSGSSICSLPGDIIPTSLPPPKDDCRLCDIAGGMSAWLDMRECPGCRGGSRGGSSAPASPNPPSPIVHATVNASSSLPASLSAVAASAACPVASWRLMSLSNSLPAAASAAARSLAIFRQNAVDTAGAAASAASQSPSSFMISQYVSTCPSCRRYAAACLNVFSLEEPTAPFLPPAVVSSAAADAPARARASHLCGTVIPLGSSTLAAAVPCVSIVASFHISSAPTSPDSTVNAAAFRSQFVFALTILCRIVCVIASPVSANLTPASSPFSPAPFLGTPFALIVPAFVTSIPRTARNFALGHISSVLQNRMVVSLEHVTAMNGRALCVAMAYTSARCTRLVCMHVPDLASHVFIILSQDPVMHTWGIEGCHACERTREVCPDNTTGASGVAPSVSVHTLAVWSSLMVIIVFWMSGENLTP